MKNFKYLVLLAIFPVLMASTSAHKFYVSTTNVEYVPEKASIQIISKIFIDDIEDVLEERYGIDIHLAEKKEAEIDRSYLRKYILQKLTVFVNGKPAKLTYLGQEYETDVVKAYIEITGVKDLKSLEIENTILMDLFDDQQNILHIKTPSERRSIILKRDNPKGLLNFNR
ncbi:DUF6702 family protein [Jejudonia soesokkakensis]|uniref:DUF6702 family protein n=1 Tax=Jejudonia soesokkakensis TaxID=1323432 RepID=A0ABW2MVG8_9FLAO